MTVGEGAGTCYEGQLTRSCDGEPGLLIVALLDYCDLGNFVCLCHAGFVSNLKFKANFLISDEVVKVVPAAIEIYMPSQHCRAN